jgi:hypothetical protein
MWMACHTNAAIGEMVDLTERAVGLITEEFPDLEKLPKPSRALAEHAVDFDPPMSNRKIAKALNANPATIDRDIAANAAPVKNNASNNNGVKSAPAANAAPTLPTGEAAGKLVVGRENRKARDAAANEDRIRDVPDSGPFNISPLDIAIEIIGLCRVSRVVPFRASRAKTRADNALNRMTRLTRHRRQKRTSQVVSPPPSAAELLTAANAIFKP